MSATTTPSNLGASFTTWQGPVRRRALAPAGGLDEPRPARRDVRPRGLGDRQFPLGPGRPVEHGLPGLGGSPRLRLRVCGRQAWARAARRPWPRGAGRRRLPHLRGRQRGRREGGSPRDDPADGRCRLAGRRRPAHRRPADHARDGPLSARPRDHRVGDGAVRRLHRIRPPPSPRRGGAAGHDPGPQRLDHHPRPVHRARPLHARGAPVPRPLPRRGRAAGVDAPPDRRCR